MTALESKLGKRLRDSAAQNAVNAGKVQVGTDNSKSGSRRGGTCWLFCQYGSLDTVAHIVPAPPALSNPKRSFTQERLEVDLRNRARTSATQTRRRAEAEHSTKPLYNLAAMSGQMTFREQRQRNQRNRNFLSRVSQDEVLHAKPP